MEASLASYAIIVILYNLLWIGLYGFEAFKDFYNFKLNWWFSICTWIYTLSGVFCLIYSFFY